MRLYDYWRSSSAYRVRIALRLKGVDYEQVPVNLRQGVQRTLDYLAHNQQGLVPTLETDGARLTQSLAIIEWLDEMQPEPPLLPARPDGASAGALAGPAHRLRDPAAHQSARAAVSRAPAGTWRSATSTPGTGTGSPRD